MPKTRTQWYWILDGTFAVSLLEEYGVPYNIRATKRKSGVEIGVPETYNLSACDLFTAASIVFESLK